MQVLLECLIQIKLTEIPQIQRPELVIATRTSEHRSIKWRPRSNCAGPNLFRGRAFRAVAPSVRIHDTALLLRGVLAQAFIRGLFPIDEF